MAPTYNKAGSGRARVPDGLRVYAIGDIHGRADLLERLLARIEADFQDRPAAGGRIVYLGDYVDRGPDSRGVIDILLAGPPARRPGSTQSISRATTRISCSASPTTAPPARPG